MALRARPHNSELSTAKALPPTYTFSHHVLGPGRPSPPPAYSLHFPMLTFYIPTKVLTQSKSYSIDTYLPPDPILNALSGVVESPHLRHFTGAATLSARAYVNQTPDCNPAADALTALIHSLMMIHRTFAYTTTQPHPSPCQPAPRACKWGKDPAITLKQTAFIVLPAYRT